MLSNLVELAAYAAFVVAGWLVTPTLGLVVLGAALWWIAQSLDGVRVKVPRPKMPKVTMPKPLFPKPRRIGGHRPAD